MLAHLNLTKKNAHLGFGTECSNLMRFGLSSFGEKIAFGSCTANGVNVVNICCFLISPSLRFVSSFLVNRALILSVEMPFPSSEPSLWAPWMEHVTQDSPVSTLNIPYMGTASRLAT